MIISSLLFALMALQHRPGRGRHPGCHQALVCGKVTDFDAFTLGRCPHLLMTRLRCSLPAWLALAAMLVIFLAPVLSQTLALAHERARNTPASPWHERTSDMHAGHVMAAQQAHDTHRASVGYHEQTHPAGHVDLAQCGYCSLLSHSPLMVEAALALPPSRAGPDAMPVPARLQGHARHPWFPNALSRAPPLSA